MDRQRLDTRSAPTAFPFYGESHREEVASSHALIMQLRRPFMPSSWT